MSSFLSVVILAALPFTELRLALPLALTAYGLNPLLAYVASVIGNILPVIAILMVLPYCIDTLRKQFAFLDRFFAWWFDTVHEKYEKRFHVWGKLALVVFVAIPFPLTGAWTGSVAAYLFKIPKREAFLYIVTGIMIAGLIILLLTVGVVTLIGL